MIAGIYVYIHPFYTHETYTSFFSHQKETIRYKYIQIYIYIYIYTCFKKHCKFENIYQTYHYNSSFLIKSVSFFHEKRNSLYISYMFPNYKVFENRCIYFSIICFEPSRFVHFNKFCKRDQRTKTKKTPLHGKLTHTESISMHLFAYQLGNHYTTTPTNQIISTSSLKIKLDNLLKHLLGYHK